MSRVMKDSGIPWIGEIPQDWNAVPHKQVMSKLKEIQETYNGEDIISLTMKGVVVRNLDNGGKIPMSFNGYQKVYPDNLLLCLFDIDVTPRCVGLIKNIGVTSPAYSQFILKDNRDSHYYDYLLRYIDDNKCFLHLSKNLRNSLTESDLGQIPTVVAPRSEQRAIADFLDVKCVEVDELIALQGKMIDELKVYKQSVITQAVTKGLNPDVSLKDSGIEWVGQIPEHWSVERLKNRIELNPSINPTKIDGDTIVSFMPMECLRNAVITPKTASYSDVRTYTPFQEQDIVMAKVTPCYENGNIAIATNLDNGFGFGTSEIFVIRCNLRINNNYLFYYLQSSYAKNAGIASMTGTGGLKRVNPTALSCSRLLCPPIEEQQQIADYLDTKCAEIDEMTNIKQRKIEQLKEYKKSVIYEYVTGKKQVNIE